MPILTNLQHSNVTGFLKRDLSCILKCTYSKAYFCNAMPNLGKGRIWSLFTNPVKELLHCHE